MWIKLTFPSTYLKLDNQKPNRNQSNLISKFNPWNCVLRSVYGVPRHPRGCCQSKWDSNAHLVSLVTSDKNSGGHKQRSHPRSFGFCRSNRIDAVNFRFATRTKNRKKKIKRENHFHIQPPAGNWPFLVEHVGPRASSTVRLLGFPTWYSDLPHRRYTNTLWRYLAMTDSKMLTENRQNIPIVFCAPFPFSQSRDGPCKPPCRVLVSFQAETDGLERSPVLQRNELAADPFGIQPDTRSSLSIFRISLKFKYFERASMEIWFNARITNFMVTDCDRVGDALDFSRRKRHMVSCLPWHGWLPCCYTASLCWRYPDSIPGSFQNVLWYVHRVFRTMRSPILSYKLCRVVFRNSCNLPCPQ